MRPRDRDPLAALRSALSPDDAATRLARDAPYPVSLDAGREARTGVPEVVFAPGKSVPQIIAAARGLLESSGRAIISRLAPEHIAALGDAFGDAAVMVGEGMHTAKVTLPGYTEQPSGGQVGIITAGTSDLPVADEAAVIAAAMGCETRMVADVGVAGLHRLFGPLAALQAWGADALIVVAGMDGALPSVVAGLSAVPVIGLPTSTGYGAGGKGEAALLAMLQTCAPGLVVVNIDNGIGAGVAAARIAGQSAAARSRLVLLTPAGRPTATGEE